MSAESGLLAQDEWAANTFRPGLGLLEGSLIQGPLRTGTDQSGVNCAAQGAAIEVSGRLGV